MQKVGVTSTKICHLEVGDEISDVVGPLGKPTHIEKLGTVLASGGGVGVAPLLPIVEAFKKAGNRVITVLAARKRDLIILEEQMREHSDEVVIMTDDGSYGQRRDWLLRDGRGDIKRKKWIWRLQWDLR